MEIKIFYALISLLIISTGTVFAQESLVNVQVGNNYTEGDTIVVSGNVNVIFIGTPVIIQILHEGAIIDVSQIDVAQDGTYTEIFLAEGPYWKAAGTYVVRVGYQNEIVEAEFSFSPKSELVETTTTFDVGVEGYGSFDVEYTIKGGTVIDMIVDPRVFSIIVRIESTDSGTISLDLPSELIVAEKQDGKDDTFIILIDGMEVAYQESVIHLDSRVITINFEEGDSDIEIIGTYVVPEFGTIVMMILIAGIMTVILTSRNKFQIKI